MAIKKKPTQPTEQAPTQAAPTQAQPIDINQYKGRIFILVEKLSTKRSTDVAHACKLLTTEEAGQAHIDYADGERYTVVAIPDIYKQAAINDAYKCMDYIGYFARNGVMPTDGAY